MESELTKSRPNVRWVRDADDNLFNTIIAASDFLLNFRRESVGETSGPVVKALALGIYIAGYDVGFMKEYIGKQGILFDKTLPFGQCLPRIIAFWQDNMKNKEHQLPTSSILSWKTVASEHINVYRRFYRNPQ